MRLQDSLSEHGCDLTPQAFRTVVVSIFDRDYPNQTDDWLRSRPRKAVRFTRIVREAIGCDLPDEIILDTLVAQRKQAKVGRRTSRRLKVVS